MSTSTAPAETTPKPARKAAGRAPTPAAGARPVKATARATATGRAAAKAPAAAPRKAAAKAPRSTGTPAIPAPRATTHDDLVVLRDDPVVIHDDPVVIHDDPVVVHDHELPKLSALDLRLAQVETLAAPRRHYSIGARLMFLSMDAVYGRRRTLAKFRVLEVVARVPYQSWETATYKQISRAAGTPSSVLRLWDRVRGFRAQQDNEQWHLLLLTELCELTGARGDRLRHRVLPPVMSFGYWHFCWLLYALSPRWSHRLNSDFEDHAEHEYAAFVAENPQLEEMPHVTQVGAGYGRYASVADLLRQIMHDERMHKLESEQRLAAAR